MNAEETLQAVAVDGNYLWATRTDAGAIVLTPKQFIPAPLGVEIRANKKEILALLRGVSVPALEHRLARGLDMLMEMDETNDQFWRQLSNWKRMLNTYMSEIERAYHEHHHQGS